MKVFILTLLVLNSLCFALGGEEEKNDFVDIDADEGEVLDNEPQPEDYVEDEQNQYEDMEDEEDSPEEGENDEPEDPNGFKDDLPEDARLSPTVVDAIKEPTPFPLKPSEEPSEEPSVEQGSGDEPQADADLIESLKDKLGLQ